MGSVLVGLLMFFIFVSLRVSAPDMKLLYSDLSTTDSALIAGKLEEARIRYDVSNDGSRVMVSGSEIGRARMLLAREGLPNGGSMGYEIFDKQSGFGTTNFVQNINQVRALEGELARTITGMDGVRAARVHLVLPQRELFNRESRPSSASVFVALKTGARMGKEQIYAIQHLVASGVPELKPTNVSIIDGDGNLLARGGEEEAGLLNMKAEELRRSYETRMTQAIEDMVGRVVGYGKVRATVTADLNFDRVSTSEEIFDPEQQVVRSAQTIEESSQEREPAGEVSVQNNLPGIAGDLFSQTPPTAQNNRVEETTNFEIGRTVRNMVREVGDVRRLSVAVLVDGTYTTDADGNRVYQPRSEEDVRRIEALVKSAIGFDEARGDRVEIANMQFADVDLDGSEDNRNLLFGFERSDLLRAAEIITVAIMIILVVLLVLQPMVARLLASEMPEPDEGMAMDNELLAGRSANPALTGPNSEEFQPPALDEEDSLIDMKQVEGKVKASSVRKVEDIVSTYPDETVAVLRSWMTQEN
jgi:flagellar M-ring protein FliF